MASACRSDCMSSGQSASGDARGDRLMREHAALGRGGRRMRDPDLVQRSERAATALEQAWLQWSARHGLGTGSLPPVSSYVGYSMDEPWGQPRVVFGLDAEQAERLAAVLNRDESAGPAAAAAPGRRNQDTVPWSWSVPGAAPGVPAQASEPGRPRPESARLEASRPES